jgi:hypothetical protein
VTPDRLSMEPLWRYVQRRHRPRHDTPEGGRLWGANMAAFGVSDVAEAVGVSSKTVQRWKVDGLSWSVADRAAVAVGAHPATVWGDEWWDFCHRDEEVA